MTFDESLDELLENGDRVRELCEKVLALDREDNREELLWAAPLLAKMVDHTLKFCEAICACEHRSDPDSTCIHCVFLAALDQIARGDG